MFAGSSQQAGPSAPAAAQVMEDKENMDPLQRRQPGVDRGTSARSSAHADKQQLPFSQRTKKDGRTPLSDITSLMLMQVSFCIVSGV